MISPTTCIIGAFDTPKKQLICAIHCPNKSDGWNKNDRLQLLTKGYDCFDSLSSFSFVRVTSPLSAAPLRSSRIPC
jgi:hypothetical protein